MGVAGPKCLGVVLVVVFVIELGGWGEGCSEQEKLALLQLKPFFNFQLPGDPIVNFLYDWVEEEGKESSDCCRWERVECDANTGRVIGLNLTNKNYLKITDDIESDVTSPFWRYLNASLFLPFEELKNLSLSGNLLTGCLDNEGFEKIALKLKKLEVLDLSQNYFDDSSILSSLVEIPSLKSLNLSYNELSGLPTKLRGAVEILDLKENHLDVNILVSLSQLSFLNYLDLSGNSINGSIHNNELKNLINLKELYLSDPNIENLDSFHGLINLEVLTLTFNDRINSIVSSLGPFSKCLKHLHIGEHYYGDLKGTGSIDIRDARGLKNLKSVAANNSVLHLIQQSLSLFPSLRTLHFEYFIDEFEKTVITQDLRNLTNLEELYLISDYNENVVEESDFNNFLRTDILGIVGELTSLRVLSLVAMPSTGGHPPVQDVLQLKNLESLKIHGIALQNSFLEKGGAMTSLKILSLTSCGLSGTLSTKDICQLTRLQELNINNNELRGVLPDCFSNLTFLQHLNLSSNQFCGDLSTISALQSLTYIDLSNNQFQIPSSLKPFFNHAKLNLFYGSNNNITYAETELYPLAPQFQLNHINLSCCGDVGPLPKFLYHQHELLSVDLSNINLTGEFPSWLLENNTKLKTLFLINNSLSGHFQLPFHSPLKLLKLDVSSNFFDSPIPLEIGISLPGLTILNISKNHLDGSIPTSIGDLKSLKKLDLSNNGLSGVIPENLATSSSSLRYLSLSNNRLHGQISTNFNLTNLVELYLANNNFTGSIPNNLSSSSSLLILDLSNNHFSGKIPRLMGRSELQIIVLSNNSIEGPIPKEFCELDREILDLTMNNISGRLPSCFGQSSIRHVHFSKNRLQGPIPNDICNSSRLVTLDLSNNQLTGNIPNCIGNISDLRYLVLKHNNLEGEIPIQFCWLDQLSLLDLSHNNFSGRIPSCLNITKHEEVTDIDSGTIYELEASESTNRIEMDASIQVTIKNVSYTYKGRILKYFSGIDLSSNNLTGEIPHEMGNFQKIVMLNLSHNSLTGSIPLSLSNLSEIESLDLSYNKLSGSIPSQFTMLGYLAYFNVSYNNLSGKPPPRKAQFASNFDESSYWGNPFLCGEPLPKNCSTTPNQRTNDGENDEDGGLIDIECFYVTFTVSYIMAVLCIATVMYINPHWRRAWFYLVERSITSCFYFVIDNLPTQFRCGNI